VTGLRGVLMGALTLIAIQTLVSTSGAASRTAGAFHDLAAVVNKVVDPSVPFFTDHSTPHPTTTTSSATYHQDTGPAVNPRTAPPARSPGITVNPPAYSV
jgi:hypothetical protein